MPVVLGAVAPRPGDCDPAGRLSGNIRGGTLQYAGDSFASIHGLLGTVRSGYASPEWQADWE